MSPVSSKSKTVAPIERDKSSIDTKSSDSISNTMAHEQANLGKGVHAEHNLKRKLKRKHAKKDNDQSTRTTIESDKATLSQTRNRKNKKTHTESLDSDPTFVPNSIPYVNIGV